MTGHFHTSEHPYRVARELIYAAPRVRPLWLREFRLWFINRPEFYIQNYYSTPENYERGAAYFRAKEPISDTDIALHLRGLKTIGCYAVTPEDNTSKWFCLDADCDRELADAWLGTIQLELEQEGVSSAWEHSRRGGHLWILCDEPVPAEQARIYLFNLLDSLSIPIQGVRGNREGVEVNPKQATLDPGQFGNGVRAPLGIHRKDKQRYWFRDAEAEIESQFAYLRNLPRLRSAELDNLTLGMTMPDDLMEPELPAVPFLGKKTGERFDIRLYIPPPRKTVLRSGYFTQCPACRDQGKDNHRDNLHVTPAKDGGPPVFFCHAGCTFLDIKDACGR